MAFLDLLVPVRSVSADELRAWIEKKNPREYVILDAREAADYEAAHLPGARSLPLSQRQWKPRELDLDTPVVVYCDSGLRSRAAAGVLTRAGLKKALYLAGGLRAWDGLTTSPLPRAYMTQITRSIPIEQLIAVAWIAEDGARRFYAAAAEMSADAYTKWAFREIGEDEAHHQRALEELHRAVLEVKPSGRFPYSVLSDWNEDLMEGGMSLREAVSWARAVEDTDRSELAAALECNAQDLHLAMARQIRDRHAAGVFRSLAAQEGRHLRKMLALLKREGGDGGASPQ